MGGEKGKSQNDSIISSVWSNIKGKKTANNFNTKPVTLKNTDVLQCTKKQISTEHINDVEWVF